MKTLWNREPVVILALLQAAIALVVGFGLDVSAEQVALIMTFAAAILALVARSQVVPVAKLPDAVVAQLP